MAVERIQNRRGTASQWSTTNPKLGAGEIGVETDTGKFKVGNGTDRWSDLLYFEVTPADAGSVEYIPTTDAGVAGGVATLDNSGYVPVAQLAYATQYTNEKINTLIGTAPATLDTLQEIATALGNDNDLAGTLNAQIAAKAPINNPTFTGTVTAPTIVGDLTGDVTGNLTGTASNATKLDGRQVFVQSTAPTTGMQDGDIWIQI